MIEVQTIGYGVSKFPGALVNNAAVTCTAIDTVGVKRVTFVVILGATDIALTALKLTESDDDSSYSDVSGSVFGTATNIDGTATSLPSSTDDNKVFVIDVAVNGLRKRYLKPAITVGNGTNGAYVTVLALKSQNENAPSTSTAYGAAHVVRV